MKIKFCIYENEKPIFKSFDLSEEHGNSLKN